LAAQTALGKLARVVRRRSGAVAPSGGGPASALPEKITEG
jgi:hypothetical protein